MPQREQPGRKLLDKRKWVNEALKNCFGRDVEAVCFLMTDIALPITNFSNEEIILINYEEFLGLIEMAILEAYWVKEIG